MSMDIAALSGAGAPHAVSGASWSGPPQQKMGNLFDSIDTAGTGSISQAQFAQALQTKNPPPVFQKEGLAALWSQLDPTGSGSVSKSDFVSTMSKLMASLRAERSAAAAPSDPQSALASTSALGQLGAAAPAGSQFDLRA